VLDSLILQLVVLLALVGCSALLTGAEAAYFSLGRARLRRLAKQPGTAEPVVTRPHDLLVTLLVGITLINKAEVRLVNERRGLKSMTVSLAAHRMSRDTAQLIVHERDELVGRSRVALTPRCEQRGDVRPCWLRKV